MSTPAKLQPIAPTSGSGYPAATGAAPGTGTGPALGKAIAVTEQDFATLVKSAQAEYYTLSEAVRGKVHQLLNDIESAHQPLPALHTLFRAK